MLDLSLVDTDKFSVQFWRQGTDLVEQGNSVSFNFEKRSPGSSIYTTLHNAICEFIEFTTSARIVQGKQ